MRSASHAGKRKQQLLQQHCAADSGYIFRQLQYRLQQFGAGADIAARQRSIQPAFCQPSPSAQTVQISSYVFAGLRKKQRKFVIMCKLPHNKTEISILCTTKSHIGGFRLLPYTRQDRNDMKNTT
jgi:hypothetical protein